jgi:hypothetical protein
MTTHPSESIDAAWCRIGVLLPVTPASASPDLERLLIQTARELPNQSRLFVIAASWLITYGALVAKHRLKRLIVAELEAEHQAAMGLLLETAVELGASRELLLAASVCRVQSPAHPLFASYLTDDALTQLAAQTASARSRSWGVWAPPVEIKEGIIRPASWVLGHNATYAARAVRRGDLRCSILESLRHDSDGVAASEACVARLSGATRAAVRKALAALVLEGEVELVEGTGVRRAQGVRLARAG